MPLVFLGMSKEQLEGIAETDRLPPSWTPEQLSGRRTNDRASANPNMFHDGFHPYL